MHFKNNAALINILPYFNPEVCIFLVFVLTLSSWRKVFAGITTTSSFSPNTESEIIQILMPRLTYNCVVYEWTQGGLMTSVGSTVLALQLCTVFDTSG